MAKRTFALITATAALFAGSTATAAAAPGDLLQQSCVANTTAAGCSAIADTNMLTGATGAVVSPDGNDVYVGANTGIAHFKRNDDGNLDYTSCVDTSNAGGPCPVSSSVPADGLGSLASSNGIQLAISPDGADVYATSYGSTTNPAITWWNRDATTGALSWGDCYDQNANAKCGTGVTFAAGNFPPESLDFIQSLAVSGDGQSVYAASQGGGIAHAQRNLTTGALTPASCRGGTGAPAGCDVSAGIPYEFTSMTLSSNARDIYAQAVSTTGITHFVRETPSGRPLFANCVNTSGGVCSAVPAAVFANPGAIGTSGSSLFAQSGAGGPPAAGTISRFAMHPTTGALTFEACTSAIAPAPSPCGPLPAETIATNIGRLLVGPDGSVYTPPRGNVQRALTRVTSSLAFGSCVSSTGLAGCSAPPLTTAFAAGTSAMVMSPDARHVYVTGDNTVNVFAVEQPGIGGGTGGGAAAGPATPATTPPAAKPRIGKVKRERKGRYKVTITVTQPGMITAGFTGKLSKKAKTKGIGKTVSKRVTRAGSTTITLKPSKSARRRKVRATLTVTSAPPGFIAASATKTVKLK